MIGYFNRHPHQNFGDVGAGLGWTIGHTVSHRNARPPGSGDAGRPAVHLALAPDAGPAGDGRGLALRIGF